MVVNMLSQTSKMPSKSISISAFRCITGSKLAMKKGTVCFKCYARRGFYRMPNNKKAMADRLIFMKSPDFIPKMVKLLQDELRFRWFDSGDTQSHKMCEDILTIARLTPWCSHWLPSKEYTMWREVVMGKGIPVPKNVALRISNAYDDTVPDKRWKNTSTTFTHEDSPANVGFQCIAHKNKEKYGEYNCGDCRACWDTSISNIAYPKRYEKKGI
jgi:hypothetical protein